MKITIISLAVLGIIAFVATPALASPAVQKVIWSGWGVTDDDAHFSPGYVRGDTVHFSGEAVRAADGTWQGRGIFRGTARNGEPIRMVLTIESGKVVVWPDGSLAPEFGGRSDVTRGDSTVHDAIFFLDFHRHASGFQYFQLNGWGGTWYISGFDAIHGAFFKVH